MHLDMTSVKRNGKTYRRILLRESYREGKKVKKRTIANLSACSDKEIGAMKLALEHKENLGALESVAGKIECRQGLSVGAIVVLKALAERLHIREALGNSEQGKHALWQVMARVIEQGSRLSAVRLASRQAICDVLDIDRFNEDDLYANLDWLSEHQRGIEKKLFEARCSGTVNPTLYLYDVTSSYLEGEKNALGAYGYNRDKKSGKMQIVIGLLTDNEGFPVSVEVFRGNTNDTKTFFSQIEKVATVFGIEDVTMVGDRGMIKSGQIEALKAEHFHYITALTKAQIETLLKDSVIQMELFETSVCEIDNDGVRYILRRNPLRGADIEKNRQSKIRKITEKAAELSRYLKEHERADATLARKKIEDTVRRYKISDFVRVELTGRSLSVAVDETQKAEASLLDGCYVLKTDVEKKVSKEVIHERYKDLAMVEYGFRTMKTGLLETRPVYVRKDSRTRGHVFVVMLAYCLVRELRRLWKNLEITVEEGIAELTAIGSVEVCIKGTSYRTILQPGVLARNLLNFADVHLPDVLPCKGIAVVTKKKLVPERK
ncbi:MAG: IS1634 family transposase [Endomicrobiales bacterium]|jgi:transposase